MKYLICFFLLSISVFAQNDSNISVISAERLNIVYRGLANPIKIAVPGVKSFTATAPGLVKIDSLGNYNLQPPNDIDQLKINIEIITLNDLVIREQKVLNIKDVNRVTAHLNGRSCNKCILEFTKEELYQSEIKLSSKDYLVDLSSNIMYVKEFRVILPNGKKIRVKGNKLSKKAIRKIDKLSPGSIIVYDNYKVVSHILLYKIPPIKILLN